MDSSIGAAALRPQRSTRSDYLTHGHFDHAGSALALARGWDVPIYAHLLEMPYLTGRSDYPPKDPTVGGVLAQMARTFPDRGYDFGDRVRALPMDETVPALPGWRAVHTPGHTAGHICLWREADRTLLAGDALATVNQDSPLGMVVQKAEFRRPPAPFTTDWGAAQSSVEHMAELRPTTVSAGHGPPISGAHVATALMDFARRLRPPRHGRYVAQPAIADERGVVSLPPPPPDQRQNGRRRIRDDRRRGGDRHAGATTQRLTLKPHTVHDDPYGTVMQPKGSSLATRSCWGTLAMTGRLPGVAPSRRWCALRLSLIVRGSLRHA